MSDTLALFKNLKRLYFWGRNNGLVRELLPPEEVRGFVTQVAHRCVNLESITEVTDVAGAFGNHNAVKITRAHDGVVTLRDQLGCGRVIGLDDDDFPCIWS